MNLSIKYPKGCITELELCSDFLNWQGHCPAEIADMSVLEITNGLAIPVVFLDNVPVAKGFFELVDYWRNNGLILA